MKRLVVGGWLASVLLAVTTAGALAQSPSLPPESPPPWFGGRVEMPEHGFVVTVPDGWAALDPGSDLDTQYQALRQAWGDHGALYEGSLAGPGALFLVVGPGAQPALQWCVLEPRLEGATALDAQGVLDKIAEGFAEVGFESPVEAVIVDTWTTELSGGRATVFDLTVLDVIQTAAYAIERGGRAATLMCSSLSERPDDDWRPVAEAIELLPPPSSE